MSQKRRTFLKNALSLTAVSALSPLIRAVSNVLPDGPVKILLRSSWQTINIGDIGHTFGIVKIFQDYLPQAEITLWPMNIDNGVDELLKKTFPGLKIALGVILPDGKPSTPELENAFKEAAVLIHSSGPKIMNPEGIQGWRRLTSKPYGFYGVTVDEADESARDMINNAAFFYCRDTDTLRYLKSVCNANARLDFTPDSTFAINLSNEKKADAYIKENGLKKDEFICVITRLRYTPYWDFTKRVMSAEDKRRTAENAKHIEPDNEKLREVIINWVEKTGLKVLVCPEMSYEVEMSKAQLYDLLPASIRKNVVWRSSYWFPDEARSVYAAAKAMVSVEMHSPIIAFTVNTPAIHLRQPSDTRKGEMWKDIGLGEWLFPIDESTGSQVSDALMKIHNNYPAALKKLERAQHFVTETHKYTIRALSKRI